MKIRKIFIVAVILIGIMLFWPVKTQATSVELDPESFITMPIMLMNGNGTISISSEVQDYELYLQSVEISKQDYEDIEQSGIDSEKIPDFSENQWVKSNDNKLSIKITDYSGEKAWVIWAKLVTAEETYYDVALYKAKGTKVEVTGVTLNKESLSLEIGKTETLIATVTPSNATNKTLTWTSSDESVATVDNDGKITPKKVGSTIITVTSQDGNKTASCTVTVTEESQTVHVTSVKLDKTTTTIEVGKNITLNATVEPNNATNKTLTWKSSNEGVAKVNSSGVVTAVAEGTATITATTEDGGKEATCAVTVTKKATDFSWTDFSNAKFDIILKSYGYVDINTSGVNANKDSKYYVYISKNNNEVFSEITNKFQYSNDILKLTYICRENQFELSGKNYIYVIEQNKDREEKVVLAGKELEYPQIPTYGNRLDIWLYDEDSTFFSNTIGINSNRKVTYKIGKITSNDVLKAFKNDTSINAYNKLYNYVKNATYLKTNEMMPDNLNYNIVNDIEIENNTYYFVYMIVDSENGKYVDLEDVAIYQGYSNGIMCHFAFADMNIGEDNDPKEADNTISKEELPNTGLISVVIIIFAIVIGGIIGIIGYKKNKF